MLTIDLTQLPEAPWPAYEFPEGRRTRATCAGCHDETTVFELASGERYTLYPHCATCHGLHRPCGSCGTCIADDSPSLTAHFCSNACRQRGYRRRKEAIDTTTNPGPS
jgi:hypothetical protein